MNLVKFRDKGRQSMKLDGDSAMLGMLQATILLLRAFLARISIVHNCGCPLKHRLQNPKLLAFAPPKSKLRVKIDKDPLGGVYRSPPYTNK